MPESRSSPSLCFRYWQKRNNRRCSGSQGWVQLIFIENFYRPKKQEAQQMPCFLFWCEYRIVRFRS